MTLFLFAKNKVFFETKFIIAVFCLKNFHLYSVDEVNTENYLGSSYGEVKVVKDLKIVE